MAKGKKTKKNKKNGSIWKWVLYASGGIILTLVFVLGIVWWNVEGSKTDLEKRGFEDRGLPVMEINLADGLELSEIDDGPKETKYEGNEVVVYENGEASKHNGVEMKGRGNTTWRQEKKPYQIKFPHNVDLLGLGKAKKWILLSNYLDASYLRNYIALVLAEMIGVKYNHVGDFVELYINGDYRGLYYAIQKIEISKGSVDLRENNSALFEIDTLHKNEENCNMTYLDECLIFKDSKNGIDNSGLVEDFLEDLNMAEKMAMGQDFENVDKILDINSFAKYFLVNEFTVNPDAYTSSFYMYRNDEGKIAAGPVWDFDFSLANHEWWWRVDERFFSPRESMIRKREVFGQDGITEDKNTSKLVYYLMEMPEFQDEVNTEFCRSMSGRGGEIIRLLEKKADEIKLAAENDSKKWRMNDFRGEWLEMRNWIKERYDYFEEIYGNSGQKTTVSI